MSTLTYVYADSTAVLGPLATYAEPHSYDLCPEHAARFTAPRGWDVMRLDPGEAPVRRSKDDLLAIADAVREAAGPRPEPAVARLHPDDEAAAGVETSRRRHLRVLGGPGAAPADY